METEPSSASAYRIDCRDKIVQRLIQVGVPAGLLGEFQRGLAIFSKENKLRIPELVHVILPTDEDAQLVLQKASAGTAKKTGASALRGWLRESMVWLQWMMFEGDPGGALNKLAEISEGQRGVCGTSWGPNELAYCCKTCEHDPSCAICVPCFQNGNHEGHDYSIINTGNGCCDCGDVTAWKPEGFFPNIKGWNKCGLFRRSILYLWGLFWMLFLFIAKISCYRQRLCIMKKVQEKIYFI
uniref:E3 ubiquitin-protein ligase n=1 Tax=Kalanchoe fedtschenkoi TaxID=63787 RepID=A0A7N0VDK5_KALFE